MFLLQTPRLALRELTLADLDFIAALLADSEVMHFWPHCLSRAESQDWVLRQQERYTRDGHGYWLALDRQIGVPVGQAGLLMSEVEGTEQPALGYMLHRPFWGNGYATEAGAAVLNWAFEQRAYERVICLIRPENIASLRVALRLGLWPEKHVVFKGFNHLVFVATKAGAMGKR